MADCGRCPGSTEPAEGHHLAVDDSAPATVADYLALAEAAGDESFLAERSHPFLVALDDLRSAADNDDKAMRGAAGRIGTLFTAVGSRRSGRLFGGRGAKRGPSADSRVFPIKARDGSPSAWRVNVGRTHINDIHLAHDGVSKFHAYFTWSHDRAHCFLTDPGTTNGTSVNGKKLLTNKPAQLRDGDRIQLGPCELVFLGKQAFLELIRRLKDS